MNTEKSTLPAKLEEQVQGSGIELSKAESIASNYAPFLVQISEQAKLLQGLKDDNPEDVATAKRVRLDLGKISAPVTAQKKTHKDLITVELKFIDGLYNTVEGFRKLTIEDAKLIELASEKIEEARLAELKTKRIAELAKFDVEGEDLNVEVMNAEVYDSFLTGCKSKFEARQEADRLAEENRIKAEAKRKSFDDRTKILLPYDSFIAIAELTIESTEEQFNELLDRGKANKETAAKVVRLNDERTKLLAPYWDLLKPEQQEANHGLIEDKVFDGLLDRLKATEAEAKRIKEESDLIAKEEARRLDVIVEAGFSYEDGLFFVGDFKRLDRGTIFRLSPSDFDEVISAGKFELNRLSKVAEAKAKADAEAKTKAETEAAKSKAKADKLEAENKARIAAEATRKSEAEAKAKADAAKPVQEKILKAIHELQLPNLDLGTVEGNEVYSEILEKFMGFKTWSELQINQIGK